MSGHSKWNNIKRKKEKTDGARAKVFTKIGREISVAVRDGGPNPASNSKLADLIAKAKRMSVPNDNIQRIIKKAEGGDKTEFEAITYEGYGPGGVAVMVETLTDNRNRTAADLRHYFDKNGGNLGAMGCVGFLFSQKGVIDISLEDKDADEAMMDALDAGAEDFDAGEEAAEITTDPENYSAVVKAMEEKGLSLIHILLEEIRRIRAEGVDREIFTRCKNEKYGQLIENLENVEDSASQMADFALSGQTVAQQIATLAALTAEDADAALQKILSEERMAVMYIQPDGTAGEEPDDEEEMEE